MDDVKTKAATYDWTRLNVILYDADKKRLARVRAAIAAKTGGAMSKTEVFRAGLKLMEQKHVNNETE